MSSRARRALVGTAFVVVCACGARTGLRQPTAREPDRDAGLDAGLRPGIDAGADAREQLDATVLERLDALPVDAWHAVDADPPDARASDARAPDAPDAITRDAPATDAGDPCAPRPTPLADPVCERPLDARDATLSCPGGFVDVVAQGRGTLRWECDGSRAEAVFAAGTYRGSREGDTFSLCIQTEFDYVDGCRWRSSQTITGNVGEAELLLSYREMAIVSDGACFPECTAEARIGAR